MNQKVTTHEIAEAIALKHGMDKKEAELFIKGMFELIEEALATEKYVKVKGLGTFKLTEVDSRESVDVNTGERIEIQGHTKISFLPDAGLKEIINRPFSHFETVLLNENAPIEDEVIEETSLVEEGAAIEENFVAEETSITESAIVEESVVQEESSVIESVNATKETSITEKTDEAIENTIADVSKEAETKEPTEIVAEIEKEEPVTPEEICTRDSVKDEVESLAKQEEKVEEVVPAAIAVAETTVQQTAAEIVAEPTKIDTLHAEEEKEKEETSQPDVEEGQSSALPPKKKSNWGVWAAAILLLIVLGCTLYYYNSKEEPVEQQEVAYNVETTIIEQPIEVVDSLASDSTIVEAAPSQELTVAAEETTPAIKQKLSADVKYEIVGTLATDTIGRGESLSQLAVKFYGETKLWTYLVKHNAHIKNPDNVPFGTVIKIPELRPIGN